MLKSRPRYLEQLIAFKDSDFIKVIIGMRRCGKSSLLKLYKKSLKELGVSENCILEINFESADFFAIKTFEDLTTYVHNWIKVNAPEGEKVYLLLDEVQLVPQWEKAINAFRVDENVDIYLTGSNAYLLSSQLATLLSGRYVEIKVSPLTFKEFVQFIDEDGDKQDVEQLFIRYLTYGGLPPVVEQGSNYLLAQSVLTGIYDTVFVKDIAQHTQIRNTTVFNDVARYLADVAGSSVSIVNIENRLKSAHRKISGATIERYIQSLVESFIFYRARRVEVKGGAFLQGLEKYYPADLGIKSMLVGFPETNFGFTLENAVYNELKVRGYEVRVGKAGGLEIDFVATRLQETLYVQVSASLLENSTREREFAPFSYVRNAAARRMVITYDRIGLGVVDGVEVVNVINWMLED